MFFQLNNTYKIAWMHPSSKHWHQIDFVIRKKRDLRDFHITRAMTGDECFHQRKDRKNWAKLKNEVDTATKQTVDVLKRHHQDWF